MNPEIKYKIRASIISVMFILFSVALVLTISQNFTDEKMAESTKIYNEQVMNEKRIADVAKKSTDCNELKLLRLELISDGANAESWIPNMNDYWLKLANQRYGVICSGV